MIGDCDPSLADAVELLRWQGRAARFEERLWATHHERLTTRFEDEVASTAYSHGILSDLFDGLPEASRTRFLTAPETAYRLLYAKGDLRFYMGALCAEARLVDERAATPANVWTALGDW